MPSPLTPLHCRRLITKSKSPKLSPFTLSRLVSTTPRHHFIPARPQPQQSSSSNLPFRTGPSPPRLPKEEQDLFETLQRQSTGAFSTPRSSSQNQQQQQARLPPQINQSPDSNTSDIADAKSVISRRTDQLASQQQQQPPNPAAAESPLEENLKRAIEARGDGRELHPNVRRGAIPEFEGDINPKTGEVGGPKNEPLRWGSAGEWSYNGRTTDF